MDLQDILTRNHPSFLQRDYDGFYGEVVMWSEDMEKKLTEKLVEPQSEIKLHEKIIRKVVKEVLGLC